MTEEELLLFCRDNFDLGQDGLYYRKWRRGLPKDCVGKRAGNSHHSGYKYLKIKGTLYGEHRLVWLMVEGKFPDGELDHKDLDKENNCYDNLRNATRNENCANRPGWSSTGFKGVVKNKRGKPFFAYIRVDKQRINLGNFDKAEDAARAYDAAALKYFGEFAELNFKEGE